MSLGSLNGLDLDARDTLTAAEWQELAQATGAVCGFPEGHPAYDVFRRGGRPDRIKQQRLLAETVCTLPFPFADLHGYVLTDFQAGIAYELAYAVHCGVSRAEVMDVLAVANLRTPSRGLASTGQDARLLCLLEEWSEPAQPYRHPAGWRRDDEILRAGLDFTRLDLDDEEERLLLAWYERHLGEVPAWVTFLATWNRPALKQLRNRFEDCLRALPVQYLAFLQLTWCAARGSAEGIRENVLLARALGMTRQETVDAIAFAGAWYGGVEALSVAERAAGDVLRGW